MTSLRPSINFFAIPISEITNVSCVGISSICFREADVGKIINIIILLQLNVQRKLQTHSTLLSLTQSPISSPQRKQRRHEHQHSRKAAPSNKWKEEKISSQWKFDERARWSARANEWDGNVLFEREKELFKCKRDFLRKKRFSTCLFFGRAMGWKFNYVPSANAQCAELPNNQRHIDYMELLYANKRQQLFLVSSMLL